MEKIRVGFAMCGSFCTLQKSLLQLEELKQSNIFDLYPILSPITASTDTRFGKSKDLIARVENICGKSAILSIDEAEPIGPKKLLDIMVIAPCTGNTLSKLSLGITDTSVTMATKAHLRNDRPVVLAIATNDALGASAKNIGILSNTKNFYFVPLSQDDPKGKQNSLVCDFSKIKDTILSALKGEQLQPVLF